MSSISVRQIDETTLEQLRARAARRGVSMEEEMRCILRAAVSGPPRLGELAVSTFGPDHGVKLDRPGHDSHEPPTLRG